MSAITCDNRGTVAVPRPVLLLGCIGMLGRAWLRCLGAAGIEHDAPSLEELDLTDADSIARGVTGRHRLVVNCAGYTDVDGAERDPAMADRLNGTAVGELARRCAATAATLLHYSTDYVFDGAATLPYPTDAPLDPLNAYGRSKALGEVLLGESGCRFLLIRTSWMYAPWGRNFVRTIAGLLHQRDVLRVVDDQRGRPTSAEHLARSSLELVRRGAWGIFHVTDGGCCSWHQFACEITRRLGSACRVEPCTTAESARPARRPAYSVLDLARTEKLLGPMPPWRENLASVLERLDAADATPPG